MVSALSAPHFHNDTAACELLAAHGPVNTLVPGSILQEAPGTYTILGGVAEDVEITMR